MFANQVRSSDCYGTCSSFEAPVGDHEKFAFLKYRLSKFSSSQKLGMSDRLFRPSAVYEINTVVCCIKIQH